MSQIRVHHYRKGDWMCYKCLNVNFSFRYVCNRCTQLRHHEEGGFNTALFLSMDEEESHVDTEYLTPGLLPSIEPLMKII